MDGHLCVFANGSGDLTLLLPPIGDTGGDRCARRRPFEMMDEYNAAHGVPAPHARRVRQRGAAGPLRPAPGSSSQPMGADYIYDIDRMIDLAGGDLASKRQAKNRFLRLYEHRVEPYSADRSSAGLPMPCWTKWKIHQDAQHLEEPDIQFAQADKESIATGL